MAKDRVIEITGYIEGYGFSMGYIRYLMDELGDGPITVKVTSYGGDVNHALKIKEMFSSHGDVTVEYIGLNASAATLIGHGAKKTVIHEDSLYLVHKPMVWVDSWGSMNEDELTAAIAELQAQKKDAETFTLVLAQDYVNSRGMKLKTVMDLMKEARWLSAKEAVELGLVDEILTTKNKKPVITNRAVAIMKASGLPVPVLENTESKQDNLPDDKSWMDKAREFFSPKNKIEMNKTFLCINQVLNIEGIEVSDNKVSMTVEQLTALNSKIETLIQSLADANTAKDNAVSAQQTAENALSTLSGSLDDIDPTVKAAVDSTAKVAAIKVKLAGRPGVKPESPQGKSGDNDTQTNEVDQDLIDGLPHNKLADQLIF
jgi:ATP-dependent protease ClpP protease subunit